MEKIENDFSIFQKKILFDLTMP